MGFFNYIIISIPLISILRQTSGDHLFILSQKNSNNLVMISLILSLAGLPPLLGFISKFIILLSLLQNNIIILTIIMFIGTLISLYFYLNMSLIIIIKSYITFKTYKNTMSYSTVISVNIISSLVFFPIVILLS